MRFAFGLMLLAAAGFVADQALATTYYWNGSASTNWSTAANWNVGNIAPTGGLSDVVLIVTNRTNNTLYYTAANGNTVYTNTARPLRIGDGSYGSFAITGGSLETRGGNNGDFVGNGAAAGGGALLIDGGTYISTNQTLDFGVYTPATATLTVNSGLARLATVSCGAVLGTINLNGGTLSLSALSYSAGSTTVNLNGGTLQEWKSVATWLNNNNTGLIYKVNGSVTLDTQAFNVPIAGSLNGTGSVTKIGSGALSLQNSNSLAAVTLNEGTLCVNHAGALGPGPLNINGGKIDNTSAAAVTNAQNGPINIYSNFNFVGTKDLNLGTGAVTLCRSLVVTNSAKTLTFGGSVGDGGSNYALTVTGVGLMALTGNLGIGGRLTVAGSGTLTLAGANSYTGATSISAGTLIVANGAALGTTNSASDVASGSVMILTNGVVVDSETVYIAGFGGGNFGALQAASASTDTWNGAVMLNDNSTWTSRLGYRSSGVLIIGGPIKSSASINSNLYVSGEPGSGRLVIASTNNTYLGVTGILRGTLALGANNALPVGTTLDLHPSAAVTDWSKFDLAGFSQAVAVLRDSTGSVGARYMTNSSDTASVLTVNQSASTVYSGRIDGNVGLTKQGNGVLTLAGTNTYTGDTLLKGGTLALGCDGALSPGTSLTISNGTLDAGTWFNTAKQLTVAGVATIALGDGSCRLEFADCSGQAWTGTLDLAGTLVPTALRFGTNAAGLTQDQIGKITMGGNPVWVGLNPNGYLRRITGTVFRVY